MQAQDINAVFDPVSETTTITWRNTNQLWNDINDLFAAEYRVYRSSSPIDAVNIMNLQYFQIPVHTPPNQSVGQQALLIVEE